MKRVHGINRTTWGLTFAALILGGCFWSGCRLPLPVETRNMTLLQRAKAAQAWRAANKCKRLTAEGNYSEAIVAGERAWQLTQQVLPDTEPVVIAGMIDLAALYCFADQHDNALALLLRAKAIMDQHGKGTGWTRVNPADGPPAREKAQGKGKQAPIYAYNKEGQIVGRYDRKGSGDYAYCLRWISSTYAAMARYDEALAMGREAVAVAMETTL